MLYSLDRGMGNTVFSLTPALSPEERENGPLPLVHTRDRACTTTIGQVPIGLLLFPAHEPYSQVVGNERMLENRFMGARRDQSSGRSLPEGEGQGEGEMLARTRRVLHLLKTSQDVQRRQDNPC